MPGIDAPGFPDKDVGQLWHESHPRPPSNDKWQPGERVWKLPNNPNPPVMIRMRLAEIAIAQLQAEDDDVTSISVSTKTHQKDVRNRVAQNRRSLSNHKNRGYSTVLVDQYSLVRS